MALPITFGQLPNLHRERQLVLTVYHRILAANLPTMAVWLFSAMAGKVYSVYIYSSNGEEIIGLAQEANTTFSTDIRNYECVNLSTP